MMYNKTIINSQNFQEPCVNISNVVFDDDETSILSYGPKLNSNLVTKKQHIKHFE